jgi:hypothetical protein
MSISYSSRTCQNGGLLIQPWGFLPKAPFEYAHAFIGAFVGCNHLRCQHCQQKVRHLDRWEITSYARFDGKALRAAADPADLDWLKPAPAVSPRIYYCDCTRHEVTSPLTLDPLDADLADRGIELPWRCAGHPEPSPDDLVGGLRIGSMLDGPDAVRQLALGTISMDDSPPIAAQPGIDLRRLYNALPRTGADACSLHIAALLDDPEPLARLHALAFFYYFPLAAGAERVLAAAQRRASLFDEVPNPIRPKSRLSRILDDALERRATHIKDVNLIAYLRDRLLAGKTTDDLLWAVATFDWEWIESYAPRIVKADPRQLGPLLMAMQNFPVERIVEVLQRLRAAAVATEAEMETVCREVWAAYRAKLAALGQAMGW